MSAAKSNIITFIFTFTLIIAALFALATGFLPHDNMWLGKESVENFNNDWRYIDDNGYEQKITLPLKIKSAKNTDITISKTLPNPLDLTNSPRVFTLRTIHQNMKLYIDDELIYQFGEQKNIAHFSKTPGIAWNTVRLAPQYAGKELKLVITSPYQTYQGYVGEVHMGTKAATIYWLMEQNLLWLIFAVFFVAVGLCFAATAIVFGKVLGADKSIAYLSQFTFIIGLWLFCESRLTQFFVQNSLSFTNFAYYCLILMLVPLMNYIASIKGFSKEKLVLKLSTSICVLVFVSITLQALGICDTFQGLPYIFIYIAACIIITLIHLIKCVSVQNEKHIKYSTFAVVFFIVSGICEAFSYFFNPTQQLGKYIIVGAIAFVIIIGHDSIASAKQAIAQTRENNYYKRMALYDELTGCLNRTAYASFKAGLASARDCTVIMCDVDRLKLINDEYGHDNGDIAIKRTAQLLTEIFGTCYRIGGDEFVCILNISNQKQIEGLVESFKSECKKSAQGLDFKYNATIGYAIFNASLDDDIEQTIKRADESMYENKPVATI